MPILISVYSSPFLIRERREIFDEVKEKIATHLKFVKKTGFANKAVYKLQDSNIQGNEVHLRFEFAAFEKMYEEKPLHTSPESIEEIWHKNLVVPNMKRYSKLVSAYTFIENQIQVFLLDYMARTKNYTIFKNMRDCYRNPSWEKVFKVIKDGPIDNLFKDYLEYATLKHNDFSQKQLMNNLNTLRLVRNQIVHEGGFIHAKKAVKGNIIDNCLYQPEKIEPFPGIFIFANTI